MSEQPDAVQAFCQEIVRYLKGEQPTTPHLAHSSHFQTSSEIQSLLKQTQQHVIHKIRTLLEKKNDNETLLNLFVIDQTLYQLHQEYCKKETHTLLHLCLTIEKALKKHLKHLKRQRQEAEVKYEKDKKRITSFRITVQLISALSFITAFFFPVYAIPLFSIALTGFTLALIVAGMWENTAYKRLQSTTESSDPTLTQNTLQFLNEKHLKALFEPNSYSAKFIRNYFEMLTALGLCFGWIPNEQIDREDIIETACKAHLSAYFPSNKTGNADIIFRWRMNFEKIQEEIKRHFGSSLSLFNKKTKENPLYLLQAIHSFELSTNGKLLQSFLHETEFLPIKID